jgi:hypothetical protein
MTDAQITALVQALAQLVRDAAELKELARDALREISDLQARIEIVTMRFDE